MASNYTEHYGLCQWEATDQVRREEFNQDHLKIDETLKALTDKDLALESAVATVAAAAGNCQMELITYTGTGADTGNTKVITFTQLPDIFIAVGDLTMMMGQGGSTNALLIADDPIYNEASVNNQTVQWSGSQLFLTSGVPRYQMNTHGSKYWVLALHIKGE